MPAPTRAGAILVTVLSGMLVPPTTAGDAPIDTASSREIPALERPARTPAGLRAAGEHTPYAVVPDEPGPGSYRAWNPRQQLRATFRPEGVDISVTGGRSWQMTFARSGRRGSLVAAGRAALVTEGNRVEYRRDSIVEWWVNTPRGIEHGFHVRERPAGEGPLVVELVVSGDLGSRVSDGGRQIAFEDGETSLRYAKLHAFDARGQALGSRMELGTAGAERLVRLVVEDAEASYPLTIDPLLSSETKVTPSDIAMLKRFGQSVAVSGDTAIVGAPYEAAPNAPGAAYVFERDAGGPGEWGEVRKLTASDAANGALFGYAVAIRGDTAVVGAQRHDGGRGAAYVFERDAGGPGNWGEVKKLAASDAAPADWFGTSVAIDGGTVISGAPYDDAAGYASGAAYVYERDAGGAGNWGEVKKLPGAFGSEFGESTAISGDTVVVGARFEFDVGHESGAAYVYERDAGGPGSWGGVKKLVASDAAALGHFGGEVAIDADTAAVRASGSVYLFGRDVGGPGNWGEAKKLAVSVAPIAVDGDRMIAGAPGDPDRARNAGAAYLYERDAGGPGNWGVTRKVTASDASSDDQFGFAVSMAGDTAIVGAHFASAGAPTSGAAYVYDTDTLCDGGPVACVDTWGRGKLLVKDSSPGREKLVVTFTKGPPFLQADLGMPGGTAFTACIYDAADDLVGQLKVDRAFGACAGRSCWRAIGGTAPTGKGWLYNDGNWSADGVRKLELNGGGGGKSKIRIKALNNSSKGRIWLPTGIAAALSGSTSATVQLRGEGLAQCFSVTLDDVRSNTGVLFKATN